MKHFLALFIFIFVGLSTSAQKVQSIFEWKNETEVLTKENFRPLYKDTIVAREDTVTLIENYTRRYYTVKNLRGDTYTIVLNWYEDDIENTEVMFSNFSILHKGKHIYTSWTAEALSTCEYITAWNDSTHFVQVPLDDTRFALCFGGYKDGTCMPPEMFIIVVSGDNVQVVFENWAHAYKYSPPPSFAIEYIDETEELYHMRSQLPVPTSLLKKLTKHKIWKEGNVLKYKSWK